MGWAIAEDEPPAGAATAGLIGQRAAVLCHSIRDPLTKIFLKSLVPQQIPQYSWAIVGIRSSGVTSVFLSPAFVAPSSLRMISF